MVKKLVAAPFRAARAELKPAATRPGRLVAGRKMAFSSSCKILNFVQAERGPSMNDHFWFGMAVIFISGALNGAFPLPMKYTRQWKWENTWLVFAATALLIIPWVLAAGFVPHLGDVYRGVSSRALLAPLIFGFLWGIAQVTFGLGISAVGMALAFAVVAGLSCLFGSLVPLLVHNPADLLLPRGILLLIGMPILFAGLVLYGMAGRRRAKEQRSAGPAAGAVASSFMAGLAICIFTGVFG